MMTQLHVLYMYLQPYMADPYVTISEEPGATIDSDCDTIDSDCDTIESVWATNHRCPCLHGCEFGPGENADGHHEHRHYQCDKCSTETAYVICEPCVSMGIDKEHRVYMTDCKVTVIGYYEFALSLFFGLQDMVFDTLLFLIMCPVIMILIGLHVFYTCTD